MTDDDLRRLAHYVVEGLRHSAVAPLCPEPIALLDRSGLARALSVGTAKVDRLRREGMPVVYVDAEPRFDLRACLAWLEERRTPRVRPADADQPMPGVVRLRRAR